MQSTLTKQQYKHYGPRPISGYAEGAAIWATVRFDDECGNGHNTFAITGQVREPGHRHIAAGGCMHEDIATAFPELTPLLKWHQCSTDGPIHYVANTVYHVQQGRLDYARRSAVWLDATDDDLTAPGLEQRLRDRLPALLAEFRAAVESLGLVW